jgi:hypothetical protein
MIEIHPCERGDLFVTSSGAMVSSPYSAAFYDSAEMLSEQRHVTLRFDSMGDANRLLSAYLDDWRKQMPRAMGDFKKLQDAPSV